MTERLSSINVSDYIQYNTEKLRLVSNPWSVHPDIEGRKVQPTARLWLAYNFIVIQDAWPLKYLLVVSGYSDKYEYKDQQHGNKRSDKHSCHAASHYIPLHVHCHMADNRQY